MIISKKLKEQSISEYLLYMWQVEDLIRANNCDIDKLEQTVVAPYNLPDEQHHSLKELLNINSFPTYLLFDKNGKLVNRTPPQPQQKDLLLNEIQKYLDK